MSITYQRPRKLEVVELKENYGRFEAEPFERGYFGFIDIDFANYPHGPGFEVIAG